MTTRLGLKILAVLGGLVAGAANAATVGGYTIDTGAFGKYAGSTGTFATNGGSIIDVLDDQDEGTYGYWTRPIGETSASLTLGFSSLYNGAGADLVLFELGDSGPLGSTDSVNVSINGSGPINYSFSYTGDTVGGWDLAAAAIDLNDFGLDGFTNVTSVLIGMDLVSSGGTVPTLSLAGALNTTPVPVPAAVWLFGTGLIGLVGIARRKQI